MNRRDADSSIDHHTAATTQRHYRMIRLDKGTPSPADTIRTALQGAMVGYWGRENALRALAEMEAENDRLRREIESLLPHVRGDGYAG